MVEFYVPPDLPLGLKYARVVKSFAIGLIYGPMSPTIYWVVGAGFLMGCASDTCEPNEIEHQAWRQSGRPRMCAPQVRV